MSSLHELLHALHSVEQQLEQAQQHMLRGRRSLSEAQAALTRLDPDHPETVVPPGLPRADDEIERTVNSVEHVADALRNFAARL